jgi:hypothetical protein
VGVEEMRVDKIHKNLDALGAFRVIDPQFVADHREKLFRRQFGIKDEGDVGIFRDLFQQTAADCRFARSDLPGEKNKAAVTVDAIKKMGQRLTVLIAHIEISRIRCNGEGKFFETKVFSVHNFSGFLNKKGDFLPY